MRLDSTTTAAHRRSPENRIGDDEMELILATTLVDPMYRSCSSYLGHRLYHLYNPIRCKLGRETGQGRGDSHRKDGLFDLVVVVIVDLVVPAVFIKLANTRPA